MPKFSTPVLTVDAAKMHKVDTANTQSLHGMWLVFSKCADYMEEGRRLENLTWRLWTRETFCVEPASSNDTSAIPLLRAESTEVPPLSASVDSVASVEPDHIETHIKPLPVELKPTVVGEDAMMCGKGKHITSSDLERMVLSIKEKKALEPLPASSAPVSPAVVDVTPRASSPPSVTPEPTAAYPLRQAIQSAESCSTTAPEGNDSDRAPSTGSDTSVSSSGVLPARPALTKTPSIVRGFSPSQISSSYRSSTRLAAEQNSVPNTQPQQKLSPGKRKGGMFTLGGSSGDDESSFEERMTPHPQRSSLSEELSRPGVRAATANATAAANATANATKKTASFKEIVESRSIKPIKEGAYEDEDAIATDDDEDEPSESAIEDEDDEDWEDSVSESGQSSVDDRELFQRVDSRPNLVSRPSLLTMMMHQPAKMGMPTRSTPALQRSRITPPNGPSTGGSPDDGDNLTMRGPDVPRSKPIIVKPPTQTSGAHSPRTTRRNMLATELTESLRRHLLWERQQKSTTANAVFKRRHTAHDMANLKEYPGPKGAPSGANAAGADGKEKDTSKNSSWNNYNDFGPWEYHVKGW
ncbi:hypothetical protein BGW36DRAFT_421617 [Talaromyces proteolyticus]|uniref:Nitrogen regulatory protein areA GATA-like domain-containing protein n=1 Tax=Talaromyces proteolyticus TaxID=1131652 RepID=A0AAD4Q3H0_9EURO|nr:uncharacterized protein BGW36DRAFT_421617 [Talaromyces proteolyticus]KAH8705039.1 hypothetical protein BGW36DRAFT_421617 [Talaromyces proteolyticus]